MKERPIFFSSPMVRAILNGSKTQTRRALKVQPLDVMPMLGDKAGVEWVGLMQREPEPKGTVFHCKFGKPGEKFLVAMEIPSSPNDDYCAGSDGVIYSRTRYAGFGRKELVDWYPLSGHTNAKGYQTISLCHENKKVTRSVHSLVCEAFYGPAPFKGAQVRHLDGNRGNCRPSNLAWGTQAENWRDRRAHGNGMEGEKHHAAKLTDDQRAHVRWAIEHGLCSQRHAARTLGMTQGAIGQLMAGSELLIVEQDIPRDRIPMILLEIVSIRVERLQDISEKDAFAEGCEKDLDLYWFEGVGTKNKTGRLFAYDAHEAFSWLWESINGPESWDANPWVWCIEFKRVQL